MIFDQGGVRVRFPDWSHKGCSRVCIHVCRIINIELREHVHTQPSANAETGGAFVIVWVFSCV